MKQRLPALFVVAIALSSLAWGQGFSASVLGTVTDNSGGLVPKANVTVTNLGTGQQAKLLTDANGSFQAPLLPPGTYRVAVEMQGFKRSVVEPVTLNVDERQRLDFKLELGAVSENVTVSAEVAQIQTENATVGTAVTTQQVTELPLNGRNFLQLNLLVPGAQAGVKNTTLSTQGGAIEVHGLRENSNYFWVDGIDNTTQAIGQYVVNPPTYTIQEFRVMSPTYDAEFGRTAGAQVNVITRSGTNTYHGDLYEFVRNSAFDAKNFFDPPGEIPKFRRNQFGADGGGRIVKDKAFFFGAYEGLRTVQGQSASNVVPLPAMVKGDFSALSTILKDPQTPGAIFANKVIPPNRINAIGSAVASYYPAPNGPATALGATLFVSPNSKNNDDTFVAKADQVIGGNDRLDVRFAMQTLHILQPISQFGNTTNIPGFGLVQDGTRFFTAGLSETHTYSPTLVSEVRFGWNRWALNYLQQGTDTNYIQKLGLTGPMSQKPIDFGFPLFNMSGAYSNLGPPTSFPQKGPFDTYFLAPTFTWVRGKHALKIGGDYHHFGSDFLFDSNVRGTFTFNGTYSGNSLGDLLLGVPFQATVGVPRNGDTFFNLISKQYTGFVQDDFRARKGLSVTFGLRYEFTVPTVDAQDRMSNFNLKTGLVELAGQNGVSRSTYPADKKEFAPRLGISWDPTGSGKTAIRGGYGIFYELPLINQFLSLRVNVPFYTTQSVLGNGTTINLNNVFTSSGAVIPAVTGFSKDYKAGIVQEYSVGIQRELMPNLVLDMGYVGTRGARLYGVVNENQPAPGAGAVQGRRPFNQYANINVTTPAFSSHYDGLEVRAEKKMSAGTHFLISYTFSKSTDNASASNGLGNTGGLQNAHDVNAEWGPSVYDVRNRFVASFLYQLPFGQKRKFLSGIGGMADSIIGGWQINGIVTLRNGQPFNAVLPTDNSNTGQSADRPDRIGDPYATSVPGAPGALNPACGSTKVPNCWANPAAFRAAPAFTFGTGTRNSLIGPGGQEINISLAKNFRILETRRLEFRAESFNLLNKVNLNNPSNTLNANFGRILIAEAPRQLQLGLRLVF